MGLFSSIKDTVGSVGNVLGVGQVAGGITDRLGGDFSNIPIAVIDNAISGISGAGSKFDDWLRNEEGQQAAEEAAAAAEQAQLDANALQQQWQEYLMGVQQPYIEAGAEFLPQLTAFLDPEAQDLYRQQALESEGYKAIADAAAGGLIAQQSALGNRLSSGIQKEVLGQQGLLAQQYGDQAVANRLSQLTSGAGLGLNALGYTAPSISSSLAAQQQGLTNIGNIQSNLAAYQSQYGGITPYLGLLNAGIQGYAASQTGGVV